MLDTEWTTTDELSKCEKNKVMLYYAAPYPERYGYFVSTVKDRRDVFLKDRKIRNA